MASEISIKIRGTNDAGGAFAGVTKDADALNAAVSDLRGSLDGLSGRSKAVKDDLTKLDSGIRQNRQSLRDLATAFADAADESERLDIQAKMDKIEKDLNRQLKVKKIKLDELVDIDTESKPLRIELDKLLKVDQPSSDRAGRSLLSRLGEGIRSNVSVLDAPLEAMGERWGATVGAAIAPALLQVAGAAISGGAGTAGIGAAIALAVRSDADLQKAGKDLGMRLLGGLTQSAHTSFYEPIKATLNDLTGDVDQISDQWAAAFEKLAPEVRPFIDSIASTIVKLSGVIADIAGDSGPVLEAFADGFKSLGSSLGNLLTSLTSDVDGNADALRTFLTVVAEAVDGIAFLIDTYKELDSVLGPILDALNPLQSLLGALADGYGKTGENTLAYVGSTRKAADASADAAAQIQLQRSALEGLADALKAQTDPAFALIDAQKQLTEAQGAYNQAIKAHGKNSNEAKEALIGLAKASLGLESAAEKASGTFDGQVTPALRATMHAAGLTDAQIDGVAKAFRTARAAGQKFEDKYAASIGVANVGKTLADLERARAAANAFAKTYYARLQVAMSYGQQRKDQIGQNKATGGVVGQAASGVTSSGLTWVGEQGPELVDLPAGARVMSHVDSMRAGQPGRPEYIGPPGHRPGQSDNPRGSSGRRGSQPASPLIIKLVLDGRELTTAMISNLQDFISNQAGGDLSILSGGFR